MAVIYSRQDLDRITATLAGVRSIGEALAVVAATLDAATEAQGQIASGAGFFGDAWRDQAGRDISNYKDQVQRETIGLVGEQTAPLPAAWNQSVQPALLGLWSYVHLVSQQFPPADSSQQRSYLDWLSQWPSKVISAITQAPKLLVTAAGDVLKTAGGAIGDTASAILGPLRWYLVGAGALVLVIGIAVIVTKGHS